MTVVRLTDEDVERIARRVVELQAVRAPAGALVDVGTVAEALGVSRDYVYRHADELGARRAPGGRRGRLRFDLDEARAAWTARDAGERSQVPNPPSQRGSRRRRTRSTGSDVPLLPVGGAQTRRNGRGEAG